MGFVQQQQQKKHNILAVNRSGKGRWGERNFREFRVMGMELFEGPCCLQESRVVGGEDFKFFCGIQELLKDVTH